MKKNELEVGKLYTDREGRYRRILKMEGESRVDYQKVIPIADGWMNIFEETWCSKSTFAKWAKKPV
ncbi:hypothetical protein [Brevibacillus laterosporus]|uniref:Uncharacterized protein n=1 Tax=Brevibacillus laterosporus TaxID=1465 RepID=A0AAP3DLG7_BRELA|nr:hypothetical protein [Brevibacillus laterosporus]MCR8982646.1 hypothetical protein [Brevibacillus laterosporus]MCZ0809802.1 hypothetical protein [Brevibacillus laterosporus]MCZ0828364.1 hypothetical protein [Brevibacillus laterosporus]MCZ0852374.1 hypothetical protein [Brevibacillus laterosporus]